MLTQIPPYRRLLDKARRGRLKPLFYTINLGCIANNRRAVNPRLFLLLRALFA